VRTLRGPSAVPGNRAAMAGFWMTSPDGRADGVPKASRPGLPGRPAERPGTPPWGFLPPFGHRRSLLRHPAPTREFRSPRGRPTRRRLDPGGVSTFRTSESRPDWVPSLPRGPAVLTWPVLSLRPPLAPSSRGQALSPRSGIHLPELSITRRHQGFTRIHPPGLPPGLLVPGWNTDPLGSLPGLRTPAGKTCGARRVGDGHRALTRSYPPGIAGPPFR
jgi:hypothetical protein